MRLIALIAAMFVLIRPSEAAQPFSLEWMNHSQAGTVYDSEDHPDGIFVVHSILTQCPGNHELSPKVKRLARDFSDEARVQVLDVAIDTSNGAYAQWIKNHEPNYPLLRDRNRTLTKDMGVQSFPTTTILDCNGEVKYQTTKVWDESVKAEIRKLIEQLLTDDCGGHGNRPGY